jgi:hypothetical protein
MCMYMCVQGTDIQHLQYDKQLMNFLIEYFCSILMYVFVSSLPMREHVQC